MFTLKDLEYIRIEKSYNMELTIGNKEFEIDDISFDFGSHVPRQTFAGYGTFCHFDEFTGEEICDILKHIPAEVLEAELERKENEPEINEEEEDE